MLEIDLKALVEPVILVVEVAGFSVIVVGMAVATVRAIYGRLTGKFSLDEAYFRLRGGNGRSLVLGLELLVAAEIIRSITAETMEALALLGVVVIIRTFLSITLEMEMEGQWPWKRGPHRRYEHEHPTGDEDRVI